MEADGELASRDLNGSGWERDGARGIVSEIVSEGQ